MKNKSLKIDLKYLSFLQFISKRYPFTSNFNYPIFQFSVYILPAFHFEFLICRRLTSFFKKYVSFSCLIFNSALLAILRYET